MSFEEIIKNLNILLEEKQPLNFSPTWILQNSPSSYRYIWKNIRTETNEIDWDTVTSSLNKSLQKEDFKDLSKSKVYNKGKGEFVQKILDLAKAESDPGTLVDFLKTR